MATSCSPHAAQPGLPSGLVPAMVLPVHTQMPAVELNSCPGSQRSLESYKQLDTPSRLENATSIPSAEIRRALTMADMDDSRPTFLNSTTRIEGAWTANLDLEQSAEKPAESTGPTA